MQIPENLLYTEDHEWLLVEGEIGTIGITHFAQNELGDIVYVDIESSDDSFAIGEEIGSIEAVKTVSDIFIPVTGTIIEINELLEDQPDLVNKDPYGEGWLVKIKLTNLEELSNLMSPSQYEEQINA